MMRWVVSRSLRFRWLVLFAATAAMAFGLSQVPSAKVDVFPEFAPPRVEIQTIALGNSSEEVEEFITVPMEEQLNGVPGLEELRSKSVAQLSAIQLIFERGTDEQTARQAGRRAHRPADSVAADLGEPALHDAVALGHEPDPEDRAGLGRAEPDGDVGHRLLEDPAAASPGSRGRDRGHLRRAAATAARAGGPGPPQRERHLTRACHGVDGRRRGRRRAPVHGELRARDRWLRRVRRTAHERPARAGDHRPSAARGGAGRRARPAP